MPRLGWQDRVDLFRRDNRSGAEELTSQAVDMLMDAIGESIPGGAISYRSWLIRICRDIVGAQPSMGSVFTLVNDMLWSTHEAMGSSDMREQALTFLQDFAEHQANALWELTQHLVSRMGSVSRLMTYSRSSTVLQSLLAVSESGLRPRVYCSESRPMLEGQTLASELGWAGLKVVVGIDMALFSWLPEVELLLIGADSLSTGGLVNKLGTAALLREAYRLEVPCVVVCTTEKFLPAEYMLGQSLRSGEPDEIMPVSGEQIEIRNVYFDIAPLELVGEVITEKGPLCGESLDAELKRAKIYPRLRGR